MLADSAATKVTGGGAVTRATGYENRPDLHQVVRFVLVAGRPALVGAIRIIPDFFTVQPPPARAPC